MGKYINSIIEDTYKGKTAESLIDLIGRMLKEEKAVTEDKDLSHAIPQVKRDLVRATGALYLQNHIASEVLKVQGFVNTWVYQADGYRNTSADTLLNLIGKMQEEKVKLLNRDVEDSDEAYDEWSRELEAVNRDLESATGSLYLKSKEWD